MTRLMEMLQGLALPSGVDTARLIGWLNMLLVLLLAYTMATLSWQLMATSQEPGSIAMPVQGGTPHVSGPGLDSVAALHLLGEAGSVSLAAETPIDAPETKLKFTLKGVFADSREESAMAIIATGSDDEKSYRVGDTVAGAAILHQILGDRVILKRGEQLETLYLPRELAVSSIPANAAYQRGAPRSGLNRSLGNSRLDRQNKQNMGELRKQLMENPQDALQLINAQPVMENGQLTGFRVNPGRDRALFARVGLRPGDIVTSVNGMQLSDATQMGQVFQQLKSAQQLEVTVNRGGHEQHLQLKLD